MIYVKPEVGDWMVYVGFKNATNQQKEFVDEHCKFLSVIDLIEGNIYRVKNIDPSLYKEILYWLQFDNVDISGLPLFMFESYDPKSNNTNFSINQSLKEKFKILSPEDNEIVEVNLEF